MSEPEFIMKPINDPDKVVCISLELLEAYVELQRAAEDWEDAGGICWGEEKRLSVAICNVRKAVGSHE
jgi:hypothetical protein